MPRIHIYASQKIIDGINELADEGHANGATLAEVNKSSVAAELLEIGLRVKHMKNKKEAETESPDDIYRQELFSECVKSRLASQQILKMMWFGSYISIHFLSLNPLLVRRLRYSRGERYPSALCGCHSL